MDPLAPRPTAEAPIVPPDRLYFVSVIFVILGGVYLIPYYTLITAVTYFQNQYGQYMGDLSADFFIAATYNLGALGAYYPVFKWGERFTISTRMRVGFWTYVLLLVGVIVINIAGLGALSWYLTLGCVFFTGVMDGLVNAAVIPLASLFPAKFTQLIMIGVGVVSFVIPAIRILLMIASGQLSTDGSGSGSGSASLAHAVVALTGSESSSMGGSLSSALPTEVLVYFIVTIVLVVVGALLGELLPTFRYAKYYLSKAEAGDVAYNSINSEDNRDYDSFRLKTGGGIVAVTQREESDPPSSPSVSGNPLLAKARTRQFWQTFKVVWGGCAQIFIIFAVSLVVYPGMVTDVPSGLGLGDWFPVILILLWNTSDLLGRVAPQLLNKGMYVTDDNVQGGNEDDDGDDDDGGADNSLLGRQSQSGAGVASGNTAPRGGARRLRRVYLGIWVCIGLRFLIIPGVVVCKYLAVPDIPLLCFVFVGGYSNGHLGTLAMMLPPLQAPRNQEEAGTLTGFFLIFGLAIGSFVAIAIGMIGNSISGGAGGDSSASSAAAAVVGTAAWQAAVSFGAMRRA